MPQGLEVLADQRELLTQMLTALSDLGVVGTRVIKASKDDFVANLESLAPVLTRLSQAGSDLPNALEVMFTYPFPRSALKGIKGDYTNLRADVAPASIDQLLKILPTPKPTSTIDPSLPIPTPSVTIPPLPTLPLDPACPTATATLPDGADVPDFCRTIPQPGKASNADLIELLLGGLAR